MAKMVAFLPRYNVEGAHNLPISEVFRKKHTDVNSPLGSLGQGRGQIETPNPGVIAHAGPLLIPSETPSTTPSPTIAPTNNGIYTYGLLHSTTSTPISSLTPTPVFNPTKSTSSNNTNPNRQSTPLSSASLSPPATILDSGSPNQQIPTWAIPVIVIVGIIVLLFLASLAAFGFRERRRKNKIGGKDPSYTRALYRAGAVATGLFIPIWIVKRYHRSRKNENQEQQEMYNSQIPAYGNLKEQNRQSEEIVASAPRVCPAETSLSLATLERGTSVVSSLSSSTRSQGRYERLDMPPSPMSEDGLYPWKSNDLSETASGNIEKREASIGPAERTRVETPLARRSDSMSEKRVTEG